jgi:hydrogenase maturation protease
MEPFARRAAILGIGNLLMSDEGVGVRCAQCLEGDPNCPTDVTVLDGGTSTHELLEELEDLELLVIIDAILAEGPPGQVLRLEGDSVPSAFSNRLSPHQHGINDLLATLRLLGRAPRRVVLLGVTPATTTLGLSLSPAIAARVPELTKLALAEVAGSDPSSAKG